MGCHSLPGSDMAALSIVAGGKRNGSLNGRPPEPLPVILCASIGISYLRQIKKRFLAEVECSAVMKHSGYAATTAARLGQRPRRVACCGARADEASNNSFKIAFHAPKLFSLHQWVDSCVHFRSFTD